MRDGEIDPYSHACPGPIWTIAYRSLFRDVLYRHDAETGTTHREGRATWPPPAERRNSALMTPVAWELQPGSDAPTMTA